MNIPSIRLSSIFEKIIMHYEKNTKIVYALMVIASFLYLMLGAYPIVPLENDSMRIALGAQSRSLYGDYTYAYNYAEQAGTYKILELLETIFRFGQFRLFSYLTVFLCIAFVFFSGFFLKRVSNTNFLIGLGSLLLFQEIWFSGYYPNSTILAAAVLSLALLLATWKDKVLCVVLSASLFAVSFWIRFDAILIGGAFITLLFYPNLRCIRTVLAFLAVSIGVATFLFLASDISIQDLLAEYATHARNASSIKETMNNYSTILTLAVPYFCAFGLYQLFRVKQWRLIILTFIGSIPLIFAYGSSVLSPKYFLYALVFFTIPLSYALKILMGDRTRSAERLLFVGMLLFAGQYIFSPAYELLLGRSMIVYTADEARLRGAIAYTPIYYAKYRRVTLTKDIIFQRKLIEHLQQNSSSYIISQDWMTNQWVLYFLQSMNYRIKETENFAALLEDGQRLILTKGSDTVYLVRWRPEASLDLPSSLQEEIERMPLVLYIGPDYTTTDYSQKSFLSDKFDWQRLPDWGRFEAILFRQ